MTERISQEIILSTDTDVQTAAATQLDEDGASSAVSPTLGAAVVLAKYPTLLLVVLAVGVLSRDIEPPLDYAIPDSSPAANSSAEGLSRNEIRTTARAAKDENNKAGSTTATNRVFQIPNDERAKASSRYAAAKEDENKQTAYQNALYARLLEMGETNDRCVYPGLLTQRSSAPEHSRQLSRGVAKWFAGLPVWVAVCRGDAILILAIENIGSLVCA